MDERETAQAVIQLKDVEVRYGSLKALDGVSFAIHGGAVGLLGPNGAGKSTLLRTLLGFRKPCGGAVSVLGYDLPRQSLQVRQRLGYMPEKDIMSPKISAVSFLTYCGRLHGMQRVDAMERAHEVLNYVGLGDSRYRPMEAYSTGMLQRVKFAQALVHDPRLLLLDEPTNGLDPGGRLEMLNLIRELSRKRGVTVMLSSHLLPDIEYVCERVVVLAKGRLLRDGLLTELTAAREGLFELRVWGRRPAFESALNAAGCECNERHDGTLIVGCPPGFSSRTFFVIAKDVDAQIRHFSPVKHRLEEIFLQPDRRDARAGI